MKLLKKTIDSHFHINKWYSANGKSYIELLDEIQDATGLKGLCINALTDECYGGIETNVMAAIYKLHNPSSYAYANLFYPEIPLTPPLPNGLSPLEQYREFMEIGFDGIKILYKPDVQKRVVLPINDDFFNDFFGEAEKNQTPILWHVADPKEFWEKEVQNEAWNYSDGSYPSYEDMFKQTFDVLEMHPDLNICFAHFFFMENEPEKLEEIFNKYKNVSVDLTPGLMFRRFEERPEYFRNFLTKYADRIIFGSDADVPANPRCTELITAVYNGLTTDEIINLWGYKSKGISLPENVTEKILYSNFKAICPTPKPVNKQTLTTYINKYSRYFKDGAEADEIFKFSKNIGGNGNG